MFYTQTLTKKIKLLLTKQHCSKYPDECKKKHFEESKLYVFCSNPALQIPASLSGDFIMIESKPLLCEKNLFYIKMNLCCWLFLKLRTNKNVKQ